MSEDSISYREDRENLLYISERVNVELFGLEEDNYNVISFGSNASVGNVDLLGSDAELAIKISKDLGPKTFEVPELAAKLKPFKLKWSYGINARTGMKNLTNDTRRQILFASSHSTVLYNYCTNEMKHLEGHYHSITHLSCDRSGRWLVTSDSSPEGVVIFWDSLDLKPVFTLFSIYPQSGVLAIGLSGSGKYFITIGKEIEEYRIDLWLWTLGPDQSIAHFRLRSLSTGQPVKICFNADMEEHIMIVFQKQVCFTIWNTRKEEFMPHVVPQILHKPRIGELTGGTYIPQCHTAFASSSKGCILVFRGTLYTRSYVEADLRNDKVFINAIKITQSSIGVLTTTDGLLVVGDSRGHIYFFDKTVKVLYWLKQFTMGPIVSIGFNLTPKEFEYVDNKIIVKCAEQIFDCEYQDMSEEITKICSVEPPLDASLQNSPFIMRDFFVSTADCNIYAIDFLRSKCTSLFHVTDANITSIEAHSEKPYLIKGYENGKLIITDYITNKRVSKCTLPKALGDYTLQELPDSVSCIRYSPKSLHLVCGRNNGEIWILEPITLTPIGAPFRNTRHKVVNIEFSHNAQQFAYYDFNKTVNLFYFDIEKGMWEFKGKVRPHYDKITDMKFYPSNTRSSLCTIGADRHLIEYNNLEYETSDFAVLSRERIEQFAIPTNFIFYTHEINKELVGYFLIADNKGKLKLVHESTKVPRATALAPAYGCFRESPIKKMKLLPTYDYKYMVFLNKRHIGLHMLPPDGNPYKYTGLLAHPTEVIDFALSHDGQYIFTFGMKDRCVLMWEIIPRSVQLMHTLGGKELEPYYCLLEGGKSGWLFQEIQDLFFYMQILKQENIDLPRRVSDNIPLSEIPDLVRACGFYPSDFELETMMIDIKYREYDETSHIKEEINFIDFVKLFINHRPAYGYSLKDLKERFEVIAKLAKHNKRDAIDCEQFVYYLQNAGEPSSMLPKYLATLMRVKVDAEKHFEFLPKEIHSDFFFSELLGIDSNRNVPQNED